MSSAAYRQFHPWAPLARALLRQELLPLSAGEVQSSREDPQRLRGVVRQLLMRSYPALKKLTPDSPFLIPPAASGDPLDLAAHSTASLAAQERRHQLPTDALLAESLLQIERHVQKQYGLNLQEFL